MANGTMAMPSGYGTYSTANDRLKSSFGNWLWGCVALAAVIHFAMLALWPDMKTADVSFTSEAIEQIDLMQEFEIPPPPEQIARPAVPVLSTDVNISEDITIGEVTFEDNPVNNLPPPPTGETVDISKNPVFTPHDVEPRMTNRDEYTRILTQNYPAMLRDAGIGGTVHVWVFIDEQGQVQNVRVTESSGYEQLDNAAVAAMQSATFSPALNREQTVPVWVQFPVTFKSR